MPQKCDLFPSDFPFLSSLSLLLLRLVMNRTESKYVARKAFLSRYVHERTVAMRESATRREAATRHSARWLKSLQEELPRFVPFLTRKCGLEFRGRIL